MKICLVSFEYPPHIYGGAGTYAELLVKGLEYFGVDVHVITRGVKTEFGKKISRINIPDIQYWRRLFFSYYGAKLMKKILKKTDIEMFHFNEPHIILTTPGIPLISTFHSTQINEFMTNISLHQPRSFTDISELVIKNSIGSFGDLLSSINSDKIICPCLDLKKKIHKHTKKNNENIHVVPNGIDIDWTLQNTKENTLEKFNLKKDRYFLFMGRLDPIKGIEYLLKAFSRFTSRTNEYKLAIAGTGFYENKLKSIANSIDNVLFLGHISKMEEKKALYENSLAVILPSIYEAFPMVILEALALGKPIIASKVGGIPEIIKNNHNGILVKPGDVLTLEKSLNFIVSNPDVRHQMSVRNRKLAQDKYTHLNMAKMTLEIYNKLLN